VAELDGNYRELCVQPGLGCFEELGVWLEVLQKAVVAANPRDPAAFFVKAMEVGLGLADPWRDVDRLETEVVPGNRDLVGFVSRDVQGECCYQKKLHPLLGEAKVPGHHWRWFLGLHAAFASA
jgi:hypothetical protein